MSQWMEQAAQINSHAQPVSAPPRGGPAGAPETTTVITKSVTVSGSVYGRGSVLVEGAVAGEIKVDDTVTVAKSGKVKGPIQGDCVSISGTVEGDIAARTRLQLKMTGSIQGDVTTCSFTIEDGSYFNGRSHMTKPGEEPVFLY